MKPLTPDLLAGLHGEFVPDPPVLRVTTLNTVWLLRPEPLAYMRLPRHEQERSLLPDGYDGGRLEDHVWHDAIGMSFEPCGTSVRLRIWPTTPNAETGLSLGGVTSSAIESAHGTWHQPR